tara:strand:+ start:42 stop:419 length:378 start_codon:yes stop_codon:yes gene_type:complete
MNTKNQIKSLLRTILEKAKKNKIKFRFNADTLSKNEMEDHIRKWGYDIDGLFEDLLEFDVDERSNITFNIPNCFDEYDTSLTWETWNHAEECLIEYDPVLDEKIGLNKLTEEWSDTFSKIARGLI